jgi:hypothetical protein
MAARRVKARCAPCAKERTKRKKRKTASPSKPTRANGAPVITRDVKAIVYRHPADGQLYVHAFGPGGDRIELLDVGNDVVIRRLPKGPTGARAIANPDGSVTLWNRDRKPLWREFSKR